MPFLTLLSNKYVWIGLIVLGITGGAWFKINSLEKTVMATKLELSQQVEDNKVLAANNAMLSQNLDVALAVNAENVKTLDAVKRDQALAAESIKRLSTDLSASKRTLNEARKRLEGSIAPAVPVPQRIVEAIITIQDSREAQALLNKQLEGELK